MSARRLRSGHRGWLVDAVIMLGLVLTWVGVVGAATGGRRMVLYDTFRDMAWAENMRAGRVWGDPVIAGQSYWYAPGGPLLVAGLAAVTGRPVVDLYGYAAFWCNVFIPVTLYLVARFVWDRTTALVALPAVLLGSHWWLTHVVSPIPGIQGVALGLVGLGCWQRCVLRERAATPNGPHGQGAGLGWAAAAGMILSLTTWYHPLCGIVLAGTILLHALLEGVAGKRWTLLRRAGLVAIVGGGLTLPLVARMVAVQVQDPTLLRFFASELIEPEFYAHAHAPWVVPAALVGVWTIARAGRETLWVVAYSLVSLIGQVVGYLAGKFGGSIPHLLPHEFQWHGQLALGLCAAVGITRVARGIAERVRGPGWAVATLLAALAFGPAVRDWRHIGKDFVDLEPLLAETRELRAWIVGNTSLETVFVCSPQAAYAIVSGLTGRKCIVASGGHTNPAADVPRRLEDVKTLLETDDAETFTRLAEHYGATYVLLMEDAAPTAPAAWARHEEWACVEPVFASRDGRAVVYRIRAR